MKVIIIFLFLVTIITTAKTREDLKDDLGEFSKTKTKTETETSNTNNHDNKYFTNNEKGDKEEESNNDDDDDDDESILGAIFSGLLDAIFSGDSSTSNKKSKKNCEVENCFEGSGDALAWQKSFLLYSKNFFAYNNKLKVFSLTASYNYQYFNPAGITNASIKTPWLNIAKIELSLFFNLIYFNYERSSKSDTNLLEGRKGLKINSSKRHNWERFSARLILSDLLGKVYLGYDEQIFISTVISSEEKYYNSIKINKGDSVTSTNLFREFYFGTVFDKHKITKIDLGFFYLTYNKPHSLITDKSYIYDTNFNIFGSYLDFIIDYKIFHFRTNFKLGGGNSEMNSSSSNIMYFQFNGDIGLYYNITDFLKIEALAKTEYRGFYFSDFDLSDDFIFTAYTGITFSF